MTSTITTTTSTSSMVENLRNCTVLAQDAIAYSARPQFKRVMTSHGGFFVRVAMGNFGGASDNNNKKMTYRAARVTGVDELVQPYNARGLLTDAELTVDTLPGARIRLTHISNSPITAEEFDEYCAATGTTTTVEVQQQQNEQQQQQQASSALPAISTEAFSDFSSLLPAPTTATAETTSTSDSLLPPPPATAATEETEQQPAPMATTTTTTTTERFIPNPLHDPVELAKLAAILRAAWLNDMVNYVLNEAEQGLVIERNEKLQRARRNLAGAVNSFSSRIELLLQQQQQQQQSASSQQQQQPSLSQQQDAASSVNGSEDNNNNMMMMTQQIGESQVEAMLESEHQNQNNNNSNPSLALPPELLEQLLQANDRFSNYLQHSTCSNSKLVELTQRARRKNEMIVLRGERLRALRDQALIDQGLATVVSDNVWTLDSKERAHLATAFIDNIPRDTSNDPKIVVISASEDAAEKPQRIAEQAVREATQYYNSHKNKNKGENNSNNGNSKQNPSSILSKFGSQDLMDRLLRDASAPSISSSSNHASPSSSQISSFSNGSGATSSSSSATTTNISGLFSIPRRRLREEGIQQQPYQRSTNSSFMTVPQNSTV